MSDIKQINGKFYDFGTSNESFLLTAKELQLLGVKNFYFMLRIDNPRIADIDPFKKNITEQEVTLLMREAKNNMWYFARECVKLRTDAGIVRMGLHRGLAASMYCFERHWDHCLCEPRQTWKTTGIIAAPLQWAFQLSGNLTMHFFGKETSNTKKNLASLKDDIALLPEWLQFRRYIDEGKVKKSRQSTEILENNLRKNKLIIHPKPTSLVHADGMARGDSGAVLYFDEIEHTPFLPTLLSSSAPIFKTASENAALIGGPYCRVMTCTPGNLDTKVGKDALPIIKSMIPWTEKIYDMSDRELEEYKSAFKDEYHNSVEKHERDVMNVFYIEYQYYQVRKDYNWVLDQYDLTGDKMEVRREILLQRLRGSSSSPVEPEDIEYLISNMRKSDRDLLINGKWRFRLYDHGQGYQIGSLKDFDENIPYIVGIDPAGGGSGGNGDNFAVCILNPYNLQIAAEFKSPYISGPAAVKMLVTLVKEYIPKAVLVIEKNSMGIYLIQMICEQTSIKENLYWSEKGKELEDMVSESADDYELKMASLTYKKYGTFNSPKVRNAMLELLFTHIAACKQILNTEYLVDDICKLVRTPTGRIEAVKGEHDDSLFAYLHAIYIYYNGDNLENFGIIKTAHPVLGVIEPKLEDHLQEKDPMDGFFSTKEVTYEDVLKEDMERVEQEVKMLVDKFDFVYDPVYKKQNYTENPYDQTVSISPAFFDLLNDL